MANWRRAWWPGGTWFFTVNLLERRNNRLLVEQIDLLRHSVAKVQQAHPFAIHAWVVLPDHLHCILSLPEGDTDFPLRWRLIKSRFSRALPVNERRSQTRLRHGERGIWQRHYWEHLIRDEQDYRHPTSVSILSGMGMGMSPRLPIGLRMDWSKPLRNFSVARVRICDYLIF